MQSFVVLALLCLTNINFLFSENVNSRMEEVEKAIERCEYVYPIAVASGRKLVMKRPGFFAEAESKKQYSNFLINKKIFRRLMGELKRAIKLKDDIRQPKTEQDFTDALRKYTMGCIVLGENLPLFVTWALNGKSGHPVNDLIFKEWWNIEKCGSRFACP